MAKQKQGSVTRCKARSKAAPRTLKFSEAGISTCADFASVMSALMSDLIAGRVTPQVGNAVCNVGGKLLKIVEMQHNYGTSWKGSAGRRLTLAQSTGPRRTQVASA